MHGCKAEELIIEHQEQVGLSYAVQPEDLVNCLGKTPPRISIVLSKYAEQAAQLLHKTGIDLR
eukprot:UN23710